MILHPLSELEGDTEGKFKKVVCVFPASTYVISSDHDPV